MNKLLAHLMLASIVLLNFTACSVLGLGGVKKETPIVIIDAPPVRFFTAGDFNDADRAMLKEMLLVAERIPYRDHEYKFPLSAYVDVAETDSESDISAHSKSVVVGSGSKLSLNSIYVILRKYKG